MALTLKQQNFVYAFIECGSPSEAYKRAYAADKMRPNAIAVEAQKIMKNPEILSAIEAAQAGHRKRHEVTVDRLVQELANIAFANPKDYFKWGPDGVEIKDSDELTEQQAAVIQEVYSRPSPSGTSTRIRLSDKQGAMEKLAKHLGMFIDRKEIGGPGAFADDMTDEELADFIRRESADILPKLEARKAGSSRTRH